MKWTVHDKSEREMVDYFLGGMTDEEQARFEDRYFADDDLFEQLRIVKQELVDAYVRNQLDTSDRERFERHFLNSPERREQVAFAQALRKTLNEEAVYAEEKSTAWREKWFDWWSPGAWALGAVTLLLAAGVGWLFFENRQLRRELVRIQKDKEQSEAALKQELAKLQTRPLDTPTPVPVASPSPTSAIRSILTVPAFLAPMARESDDGKPVQVPAGTQRLELHFSLNFDPPSNFVEGVLRKKDGPALARNRRLRVRETSSGLSVTWVVSALNLKPGAYSVTLTGLNTAKQVKQVDYGFRVAR